MSFRLVRSGSSLGAYERHVSRASGSRPYSERSCSCFQPPSEIVDKRAADVWADGPAAFVLRVLEPLCECFERRLGECDFFGVTIGRNDGDGELVAVPVVDCTVAIDAKEGRFLQWLGPRWQCVQVDVEAWRVRAPS